MSTEIPAHIVATKLRFNRLGHGKRKRTQIVLPLAISHSSLGSSCFRPCTLSFPSPRSYCSGRVTLRLHVSLTAFSREISPDGGDWWCYPLRVYLKCGSRIVGRTYDKLSDFELLVQSPCVVLFSPRATTSVDSAFQVTVAQQCGGLAS